MDFDFADFQYVVERKEQEKICFLSGRHRYPPVKFQKYPPAYNLDITSALYKTLNKIRSNRGVGGLASAASRFPKMRLEQIPGPNEYDLTDKKLVEPSLIPFGKSAGDFGFVSKTPGPGSYPPARKCRRTVMLHTFGGRVSMDPTVEVWCISKPMDSCFLCRKQCIGDYWQRLYTTFLCLKCMQTERKKLTKFTRLELNDFKKMRNCSFMHQHEGTTAAIRLMQKEEMCTKYRKENYLDLFFDKYH